jgi:hypothetical protein
MELKAKATCAQCGVVEEYWAAVSVEPDYNYNTSSDGDPSWELWVQPPEGWRYAHQSRVKVYCPTCAKDHAPPRLKISLY